MVLGGISKFAEIWRLGQKVGIGVDKTGFYVSILIGHFADTFFKRLFKSIRETHRLANMIDEYDRY